MTRVIDIVVSFIGLVVLSPVLLVFMLLVWAQDFKGPFYFAPRVAKGGGTFTMIKLRSMVVNADKSGVNSTAEGDKRVTAVGRLIRKFKLDELTQLINVLVGQMSLVGPRPQVRADADLYTTEERRMLSVLPGITDFASIVFSDEGDILKGHADPDRAYDRLIRPWKSRLALVYVDNMSVGLQLKLVLWTAMAVLNKQAALAKVVKELRKLGVDAETVAVAKRDAPLVPADPPGSSPSHAVAEVQSTPTLA